MAWQLICELIYIYVILHVTCRDNFTMHQTSLIQATVFHDRYNIIQCQYYKKINEPM